MKEANSAFVKKLCHSYNPSINFETNNLIKEYYNTKLQKNSKNKDNNNNKFIKRLKIQ